MGVSPALHGRLFSVCPCFRSVGWKKKSAKSVRNLKKEQRTCRRRAEEGQNSNAYFGFGGFDQLAHRLNAAARTVAAFTHDRRAFRRPTDQQTSHAECAHAPHPSVGPLYRFKKKYKVSEEINQQ